jgi:membrane-bound ClpP family serine protease
MWNWKLRFIIGGCILPIIGVVLLIVHGLSVFYFGLIIGGIILLVIGLIWTFKPKVKLENKSTN